MSIEWKKSGSVNVQTKSDYSEVSSSKGNITSTLIIPNVTANDSGEYYCIGWIGMQASKSKTALLYYSGKLQDK